jgi:hypothetical protein
MKTITKLGIVLCMAGVASYADSWSGKLIDSTCYEHHSTAATSGQKPPKVDKIDKDCAPTTATDTFAVLADGKIYKLDAQSNAKVAADMRGGALKADKDGDVHITVTGFRNGDTLTVNNVKGK